MTSRHGWILAIAVIAAATAAAPREQDTEAAITAARQWLAVVDAGDYAESWRQAAAYLRNAVPVERLQQSLKAVRAPLGAVISRTLLSAVYQKSLPGAPDGEYVVIQFRTSFENKKEAVETLTPMLETDGVWRVSGYYIR